MHGFLFYWLHHYPLLGYVLAPIGTTLEGDGVLFATGYLTYQGLYQPVCMFLTVWVGTTMGDLLWYALGRHLEGKHNFIVNWLKNITRPLGPHLESRPFRTLFLSKFVYGVNHALLAKAGSMGFPKKKLFIYNLIAIFLWVVIIGGLGYISSASVRSVRHYIKYTELGLLAGLCILFITERLFSLVFKKKL